MKALISWLIGIAAFIGVFWGVSGLINLITSGIETHDLRIILKVVLWIFGFGITLGFGILAAYITGSITKIILGEK